MHICVVTLLYQVRVPLFSLSFSRSMRLCGFCRSRGPFCTSIHHAQLKKKSRAHLFFFLDSGVGKRNKKTTLAASMRAFIYLFIFLRFPLLFVILCLLCVYTFACMLVSFFFPLSRIFASSSHFTVYFSSYLPPFPLLSSAFIELIIVAASMCATAAPPPPLVPTAVEYTHTHTRFTFRISSCTQVFALTCVRSAQHALRCGPPPSNLSSVHWTSFLSSPLSFLRLLVSTPVAYKRVGGWGGAFLFRPPLLLVRLLLWCFSSPPFSL